MRHSVLKIAVVIGTRPEIIKMSPLIKSLTGKYLVVYAGQNCFAENKKFFSELQLPQPKYIFRMKSPINFGEFCYRLDEILSKESPDLVLVHGDTHTTLFGAVIASKRRIPLAHVEAGLRCYEPDLPEEINRIAVDHISQFNFVPSEKERKNLTREGFTKGIHVVGNTIVDAVLQNIKLAEKQKPMLSGQYFFLTLHRRENVDCPTRLAKILNNLIDVYMKHNVPFLFPIHPRTQDKISKFRLGKLVRDKAFIPISPLGYFDCLGCLSRAMLVLTDSGGIQEEACILRVPCITLRNSTERPATLQIGSNILVSPDNSDGLEMYVEEALSKKTDWLSPFGDGKTTERILETLERNVK